MRQLFAYLLIASFAFLSTPKQLWHSHDHDHDHDHESPEKSSTQVEEDCFVCDFDLSNLAGVVEVPFQISTKKYATYVAPQEVRYVQIELNYKSSRAPPSLV